MTTTLNKPIRRVTKAPYRGRRIVVSIVPADLNVGIDYIELRHAARRSGYIEPIEVLYDWMAKRHAQKLHREKMEKKKAGGKA